MELTALIVSHLKACTFGAVASNQTKLSDSFIFFTDIPEPYVGLVWLAGKSLPVEGGYLCLVIAKRGSAYQIRTAFPNDFHYYQSANPNVYHKKSGKWSI